MQGLQERDGGRVFGVPQGDTSWTGNRGAVDLGSLGHRRRTTDVQDGLPNQGRSAELPSGGLPRTDRDADGDADALLQPACLGYRDCLGGGKPPPPKVPTMQHDCSMEGIKRKAPRHRTVQKGRGKEEALDGGGGVEGYHGEGLRGLWETTGDGVDIQIPGTGDDSGR